MRKSTIFALILIGMANILHGQLDNGMYILDQNQAEQVFQQGLTALEKSNIASAQHAFEKASDADKKNQRYHFYLGLALYYQAVQIYKTLNKNLLDTLGFPVQEADKLQELIQRTDLSLIAINEESLTTYMEAYKTHLKALEEINKAIELDIEHKGVINEASAAYHCKGILLDLQGDGAGKVEALRKTKLLLLSSPNISNSQKTNLLQTIETELANVPLQAELARIVEVQSPEADWSRLKSNFIEQLPDVFLRGIYGTIALFGLARAYKHLKDYFYPQQQNPTPTPEKQEPRKNKKRNRRQRSNTDEPSSSYQPQPAPLHLFASPANSDAMLLAIPQHDPNELFQRELQLNDRLTVIEQGLPIHGNLVNLRFDDINMIKVLNELLQELTDAQRWSNNSRIEKLQRGIRHLLAEIKRNQRVNAAAVQ